MDASRATVVGWGVATILLALFVVLAGNTMREMKHNRARHQLQDAVRFHEGQAVWNEKEAIGMEQELSNLAKDAGAVAELRKRLSTAKSREEALAGEIARTRESVSAAIVAAREQVDQLRKKALGRSFDSLVSSSGKEFIGVKILAATDEGLRIEHADGSARIAPGDVPAPLREQLGYDLVIPSDKPVVAEAGPSDAVANPAPSRPSAPVTSGTSPPSVPISGEQTERLLMEQRKEFERAAKLLQQADRFDEEARRLDEEARKHRAKAAQARMAGRPSMQDAEATKDTQVADSLRTKSANMRAEASRIQQAVQQAP